MAAASSQLAPIYTIDNCSFAYQLNWALSIFWRVDPCGDESWLPSVRQVLENDGIRVLRHRYAKTNVSQFVLSTQPHLVPIDIIRLVKGRLQYAVRDRFPKALKRNYGLRSIGFVTRSIVERYVEKQLGHHPMADPRMQERLAAFQYRADDVDLSQPRQSSHGLFWYNLHVVMENADCLHDVLEATVRRNHEMVLAVSRARHLLLSRAGILSNHMHLTVGCTLDKSPADIALCYMNNLAYGQRMSPFLRFGAYIGTFSEYDLGVLDRKTSFHGSEPRGEEWYSKFLPGRDQTSSHGDEPRGG